MKYVLSINQKHLKYIKKKNFLNAIKFSCNRKHMSLLIFCVPTSKRKLFSLLENSKC